MDEGRENNRCAEGACLPLIKKVLYGVLIDNRQKAIGNEQWAHLHRGNVFVSCLLLVAH
jgi:hypothetical protein